MALACRSRCAKSTASSTKAFSAGGLGIATYGNFLELAKVQVCEFTQERYTEYACITYTVLF
jgi:hypothetical protein